MAWYKTGTLSIAANSKKATGHGTRWADNKQGIGPGQMLLLPGTGAVALYEIASVLSDTELLLVSGPPKAVKEASYAIVTYNGGSYVDFGRELSAQLRYYQRQMDGWQQIMTGEGEVTLEAPDGTQVTLSSFKKLAADVAGKMDKTALDGKADKTELDKKADKSALDGKADKAELEGKLDKTGGTVNGALHVTHSVNVGDVDSGLIANGDGSVALYAQGVKTGEWNKDRLHWVQNLEVGGKLTASGGATFGGNVHVSWGGRSAIFHENGDTTGPVWGGALSGYLEKKINSVRKRTREVVVWSGTAGKGSTVTTSEDILGALIYLRCPGWDPKNNNYAQVMVPFTVGKATLVSTAKGGWLTIKAISARELKIIASTVDFNEILLSE